MKNKFHGYYRPSEEEFKELWENALVVLDANVLLNLYTYSADTSKEILGLLDGFEDRLWLPYQVAEEYHRNRCSKIMKEVRRYDEISRNLHEVRDNLSSRKRHPFIAPELYRQFEELVGTITKELDSGKKAHSKLVHEDTICDEITKLFDDRLGDPLTDEELDEVYKQGKVRYEKSIPPGYKDDGKPEPERYGDLVLWNQLLKHAKKEKTSVIFVTDDAKGDWWQIVDGTTIGPRAELLHECLSKTKQTLYLYRSDTFVDTAKEIGKDVSEQAVKEVQAAAMQRRREGAILSELLMGSLAMNTAKEAAMREAMMGPAAAVAAREAAMRKAMMGPVAEHAAKEAEMREAMKGPLSLAAAQQAVLSDILTRSASSLAEPEAMQDAAREVASGSAEHEELPVVDSKSLPKAEAIQPPRE